MDWYDESEIKDDFQRAESILGSGIFEPGNAGHPLFKSAFIELLICLRDLMYKAAEYATPIDFTDDVTIQGKVKDVSSLIKYVRDALCHVDSNNHYIDAGMKASFNVQFGRGRMKVGALEQVNPYPDDTCFFFGTQRIYLKRHVLRAFDEARNGLSPLIHR
ncbi:MAG: hypothetical protein EHM18_16450 [Acidobacteria bacterium]|nr:MAG: hypothetical protein EHM18_16450 [Acidobacteriota bacterium]